MRVVAVGLSRFSRPGVRPLPFAASDAKAFADATESEGKVRLLTDHDATVANVTAAWTWLCESGPQTPRVVFLASQVVRIDDELSVECDDASLSLSSIIESTTRGGASRVMLYLDLFRGNKLLPPIDHAELSSLITDCPGAVLLLSDDGSHGSHVSGELQAGIWAKHITAAISGTAGESRTPDGRLTVATLRQFLSRTIPRSLSRAFAEPKLQSPLVIGGDDNFELAGPSAKPNETRKTKPPFAEVRLTSEQTVPVKSLGGFRKSVHAVPSDCSASSREWVARLAEPDIAQELEETSRLLRKSFGYKRKDVRVDGPLGGGASILTPDFAYHLSVQQHIDTPGRAVFQRTVSEIRNIERLAGPDAEAAFPKGFTSLFQPFQSPADIEGLIDILEEELPPGISEIDYPTDLSYCELTISGFEGRVRIERQGITISTMSPASPSSLAAQYAFVKTILK